MIFNLSYAVLCVCTVCLSADSVEKIVNVECQKVNLGLSQCQFLYILSKIMKIKQEIKKIKFYYLGLCTN